MDSDEFNALTTLEKLQFIDGNENARHYTLEEIANAIDNFQRDFDTGENDIQLVQFLNETNRGRGCLWCGG